MGKAFEPTEKDRGLVAAAVRVGVPEDEICALVINPETRRPLSPKTLRRCFRAEIRSSKNVALARVEASLFRQAIKGNVTACIFYLKTQARWREADSLEGGDPRDLARKLREAAAAGRAVTDVGPDPDAALDPAPAS
jgi:hypothetical protein